MEPPSPLPLRTCVLRAASPAAYAFSQAHPEVLLQHVQGLAEVAVGSWLAVLGAGGEDAAAGPFRFNVCDCSPVACGKAVPDTAIATLSCAPPSPNAPTPSNPHTDQTPTPPGNQPLLKLSTFTRSAAPTPCLPPRAACPPEPTAGVKLQSLLALRGPQPPGLAGAPTEVHPWDLFAVLEEGNAEAGLALAVASPTTLKRLAAFHQSWVLLCLTGGRRRLAFLVAPQLNGPKAAALAQELGVRDDVIYVHPTVADSVGVRDPAMTVLCLADHSCSPAGPPLARSITLLPVQAPTLSSPAPGLADAAVRRFFAAGRCVAPGDVVAVPLALPGDAVDLRLQGVAAAVDEVAPELPDPLLFRVGNAEGVDADALRLSGGLFHTTAATALVLGPPVCAAPPPFAAYFTTPALPGGQLTASLCPGLAAYHEVHTAVRSAQKAAAVSSVLIRGRDAGLIQLVVRHVASEQGLHLLPVNCHALELALVVDVLCLAARRGPALVHLRHWDALVDQPPGSDGPEAASGQRGAAPQAILALQEALEASVAAAGPGLGTLVVVLSCEDAPLTLRNIVDIDVEVALLSANDRAALLTRIFRHMRCTAALRLDVPALADRTAGLTLGDIAAVLQGAVRRAVARQGSGLLPASGAARDVEAVNAQLVHAGVVVPPEDVDAELDCLGKSRGLGADAGRIANVEWEDVGGLAQAKREILDVVQLPLQQPQLFGQGLRRRSGVLLYGPPGCGKTLLAKAVASQCALRFLSVKGPELVNMYVGESERNVREVFARARDAAPCVVFFDELDSVAPRRGAAGDSGGVMDRVVSQLLAELDGAAAGHGRQAVFVLGATNRPDLLDTALLRPGRLDRLVYVGCPETRQQQELVLQAQLRKFPLAPDVRLEPLLAGCPLTLTGADFKALATDALMAAVQRALAAHREAPSSDSAAHPVPEVAVGMADLEAARDALVPSVSPQELAQYEALRRQYELRATGGSH